MKPQWQRSQERSRLQEQTIARELRARRVAGSGAIGSNKGDVTAPDVLIEAKSTLAATGNYTLKRNIWSKIEGEAQKKGKEPVLQVDLLGKRLVVLDWNYYQQLRDSYLFNQHKMAANGVKAPTRCK